MRGGEFFEVLAGHVFRHDVRHGRAVRAARFLAGVHGRDDVRVLHLCDRANVPKQAGELSASDGQGLDRHRLALTSLAGREILAEADAVLAVGTRFLNAQEFTVNYLKPMAKAYGGLTKPTKRKTPKSLLTRLLVVIRIMPDILDSPYYT